MKNAFKQLMNKTHPKDEADEFLEHAIVPALTALGVREQALAILECGETKDDVWGVLIGIHMEGLTALERSRVKQIVKELKTFGNAPKGER